MKRAPEYLAKSKQCEARATKMRRPEEPGMAAELRARLSHAGPGKWGPGTTPTTSCL